MTKCKPKDLNLGDLIRFHDTNDVETVGFVCSFDYYPSREVGINFFIELSEQIFPLEYVMNVIPGDTDIELLGHVDKSLLL